MKRLPMILLAIPVIALVALFTSSTASAAPASCGPGPGWVDPCPVGDDDFPNSGAVVGIDFDGDCSVDPPSLILNGPTTIHRQVSVPDTIQTEITSMSLVGGGFTLNAGASTVNPNVLPSLGAIVEQVGDDTLADSFFDVFFEIVGGPVSLYNHDALTVEAVIDRAPPFNTTYLHPIGICIDLFDDPIAGSDTGINLVEAEHNTGPGGVGGTTELLVGGSDAPAEGSGSGPSLPYAALAGAAVVALLATSGWYVRRRRLS